MERGYGNDNLMDLSSKFNPDLLKETLSCHFKDTKLRIKGEMATLVAEVASALILEAALRSHTQAMKDGDNTVEVQHVEKVLPQLLLDFN